LKIIFRLRVVQADAGDCLILEFGSRQNPRYILVDGGAKETYEKHLKDELHKIKAKGHDLMILSHVDNDHIVGLCQMLLDRKSLPEELKGLPIIFL
jgi:beta-lactamase superfamily II metal-dependent hydrolase